LRRENWYSRAIRIRGIHTVIKVFGVESKVKINMQACCHHKKEQSDYHAINSG
jgi:hypothetical protein